MRTAALASILAAASLATQAQPADTKVKESTNPARAAAVEREAGKLKARPVQPSAGLVRATSPDGYKVLSGGVTVGDRAGMQAEKAQYSLWIATVAKPSGAYLADVGLQITDAKSKKVVLERKMDGPWLMIQLPQGQYDVVGRFRDSGADKPVELKSRASVLAKGQRQVVLRFASSAMVDPDTQGSEGNPFGAQGAKKK